jgi:hypothetical protein
MELELTWLRAMCLEIVDIYSEFKLISQNTPQHLILTIWVRDGTIRINIFVSSLGFRMLQLLRGAVRAGWRRRRSTHLIFSQLVTAPYHGNSLGGDLVEAVLLGRLLIISICRCQYSSIGVLQRAIAISGLLDQRVTVSLLNKGGSNLLAFTKNGYADRISIWANVFIH